MSKHHGVLLDHARAQLSFAAENGKVSAKLLDEVRQARGFQLTYECTKLAAAASFLPANKLLAMARHSHPPVVPCFIEWPARGRSDGIREQEHFQTERPNGPDLAGYLIVQGPRPDLFDAYLFTSEEQKPGSVSLLPISYRWSVSGEPFDLDEADLYLNKRLDSRWDAGSFFFTTPYIRQNKRAKVVELISMVRARWAPFLGAIILKWIAESAKDATRDKKGGVDITLYEDRWEEAVDKMGSEQGGDVRWLFGTLGLLNLFKTQVSDPRTAGTGRFLFNRKPVKYSEYSTVDILVPGVSRIDYISRQLLSAARKRAHGVRGFQRWYRRDLIADDCGPLNHDLEPLPGFRAFERCKVCGIKVTKVREHRRGDPSLGTVQQSYRIDKGFADISMTETTQHGGHRI